MLRRAAFLDRDGVLNANLIRAGKPYAPRSISEFRILDGVDTAVRWLKRAGFLTIIITNQPDVAAGFTSRAAVDAMHEILRHQLLLDDVFVCWHRDLDHCDCRKPKPGMLLEAAAKYGIELSNSYMIGDRWRDILAGQAAGCFSVLVDAGLKQDVAMIPDARVFSLIEAAKLIISRGNGA